MNKVFLKIKKKLIVSCQASGKEPLNSPEILSMIAKSCVNGGAAGIRTEGFLNVDYMVKNLNVPIIGLIKSNFPDGLVRITGTFKDFELLLKSGCDIIAIDGTFRKREKMTGPEFIYKVKKEFNCKIMADIATVKEAFFCYANGADCISTTLSGYTPETIDEFNLSPNLNLLRNLVKKIPVPVIAEGKYNTPRLAGIALQKGAWSVVVGTAITRPAVITKWFVTELKRNHN